MKRIILIAFIGMMAFCLTADQAVAGGRKHHRRHGTKLHFGSSVHGGYRAPHYPYHRSRFGHQKFHRSHRSHFGHQKFHRSHRSHFGHKRFYRSHRSSRLVFVFPVVIWSGLSTYDRNLARHHTYVALEEIRSGDAVEWRNPDTGVTGKIAPQPAYQDAQGRNCREFQQTVTIGGQEQEAYGTACRQPDGSWQVVR